MTDEMRVRVEDYDAVGQDLDDEIEHDPDFDLPDCDFCDDRGCEECHPDDFASLHLKWVCDGARTIDEALESLQDFIKDLQEYQANGFDLSEPVDSGHFWVERCKSSSSSEDETPA